MSGGWEREAVGRYGSLEGRLVERQDRERGDEVRCVNQRDKWVVPPQQELDTYSSDATAFSFNLPGVRS